MIEQIMNEFGEFIIGFFGVTTAFFIWLQLRTQAQIKDKEAKIEMLESEQIKIVSEQIKIQAQADTTRKRVEIYGEVVAEIPKARETWQGVINRMSEHRLEGDRRIAESQKHLASAIEGLDKTIANDSEQTSVAINNLSHILEIQAQHYQELRSDIKKLQVDSNQNNTLMTESQQSIQKTATKTHQDVSEVLEAVVAIRDRVIPLIEAVEKKMANIDSNKDIMSDIRQTLEDIKGVLVTPDSPIAMQRRDNNNDDNVAKETKS